MLDVVLIIAAIITLQIFISIIGKVINNNGNSLFEYVYSAFDDNDAIPMTNNILLNVVTPVVFMVVAYDVCKYFRLNSIADVIWIMVPGYYFYRFIVIALFLGRKEFYNCKYELIIALIGSIMIENSTVQISDSSIHNCKRCALSTEESNLRILNCKIYDCIDEVDDLVILDDETQIENLEIYSNIAENTLVRCDVESVRITSMTVHDNKYRRDYLVPFEDKINSVKNEIIPWTQKRKYVEDM